MSYMYSEAKVLIFLHIPILFANYLMDSYQFLILKGLNFMLLYKNSLFIHTSCCLFLSLLKPPRRPSRLSKRALGDVRRRLLQKGRKKDTS